jgi:uncharacterized protein (DUF1778 family)
MAKRRIVKGIEVETGSGNVFADLGLRNADKLKIKLDTACTAAEQTSLDQCLILADRRQWDAFNKVLDRPARARQRIVELLKHKAPWE